MRFTSPSCRASKNPTARTGQIDMDQGRFFSDFEDRHHAPVAVIGADVVKGLFGEENPIGKMINSDGLELEVVGTMHRPSATFFDQSDNRVILPFSSMMKKYPNARDMALIVTATDGMLSRALDEVPTILRIQRHVRPTSRTTSRCQPPNRWSSSSAKSPP